MEGFLIFRVYKHVMKYIIFTILFFTSVNIYSQKTVGVINTSEDVLPGYIFFSPFSGTNAYMIDQCGQLVNKWERGTNPGLSAYFLDNGLMLRTYKPEPNGPFTSASNAGGLELVDWNNDIVWSYEFNTSEWISHHDATIMPNGNILLLTWDLVYTDELIEMGRDPNEISSQGFMWSERIIEVEPIGSNDMEIVWQWEIKDHYVQELDSTKLNFAVVADHPELFDLNLPELNSSNSNSTRDWNHMNAIDYNENLDQILISVRNSDEIWIIDHSTTTEEATTYTGGTYGKGGDILFRWGNANAYDRAPVSDQKLFGQHGVNWIDDGLEDEGKILIFNNGNGRPGPDFSTSEILVPEQTSPGFYILPETDPFGPENTEWSYDGGNDGYYSPYLSNAQRLSNGHTLINAGSPGYIFEIDENDEIVWEYVIPLQGNTAVPQGANPGGNSTFRAYKFDPDFPGFDGIEIQAGELIESDDNPLPCLISSLKNKIVYLPAFSFTHNRDHNELNINNPKSTMLELNLFDIYGNKVEHKSILSESIMLPLNLSNGIYFLELSDQKANRISGKVIITN